MKRAKWAAAALAAGAVAGTAGLAARGDEETVQLVPLGVYKHGGYAKLASEIPAYDPATKRIFVVNVDAKGVDVLDASEVLSLRLVTRYSVAEHGAKANSVAIHNGVAAVTIDGGPGVAGRVLFLKTSDLSLLGAAPTGPTPDMVAFSPDGRFVVVADEGEPSADNTVEPPGSVSIIDVSKGFANAKARVADFEAFNDKTIQGAKFAKPDARLAQDAEPEYVAISPDSRTAYVTLQENNAIAIVDLASAKTLAIKGLGFKDWSQSRLDPSDRDRAVALDPWPVFGMYQPDAIGAFATGGQTILVTANEGDSRDRSGYSEEARVEGLKLDPTAFRRASRLQRDLDLGRLVVTKELGDVDRDGDYDALYTFGGRSIATWTADGQLLWDSGDAIEAYIAKRRSRLGFNLDHEDNANDARSDNKGPEPEGLALGVVDGRMLAFVGLERQSGIVVFDVTNPRAGALAGYATTRNLRAPLDSEAAGDLGPEGLAFVPASVSPNGAPLLIVSNEQSGTTRVWLVRTNN